MNFLFTNLIIIVVSDTIDPVSINFLSKKFIDIILFVSLVEGNNNIDYSNKCYIVLASTRL